MSDKFRTSPKFRVAVRSIVVAILGYIAAVAATSAADGFDAKKFLYGLVGSVVAALYPLLGVTTPLEPFVGKKTTVEVPVPPADPEPAT